MQGFITSFSFQLCFNQIIYNNNNSNDNNNDNNRYVTPGKNDEVYIEKVDGRIVFAQNKYLLQTLIDVLDITNRCTITSQQPNNTFLN